MTIKRTLAILLVLSMLLLCACGAQTEPTDTPETSTTETTTETTTSNLNGNFEFTKENYPRMGGSLANLPLGQAVTATVLGISREESNDLITFAGSTTDNYKAIVDGRFDILLAYEPSEEAKQYIKDSGEELEMTPIGVDALVFICSKPANLQVVSEGKKTSLKLIWNAQDAAKGYQVFRSASGKAGSYERIAVVRNAEYKDNRLESGTTYYYAVRAYDKQNGKYIYSTFAKAKQSTR